MSDNRTRVWFALFVLAVFCVGMAAGTLVGRRLGLPPSDVEGPPLAGPGGRRGGAGPSGPSGASPARLIDRLDRELQLTDEQKAGIQKVFEARREPLERAQREMRERMDREQRELQAEIRKVLTAEQQPKFDRWLEEDRERSRGRGRGRGRGLGPPGAPMDR
jgi:Spy/CpxP family protein refolding chaperone